MSRPPKYRYQPPSREEMERRARQTGGNFEGFLRDNAKTFQPKRGANCVRILPGTWEGARYYGLEVFAHYRVGPAKSACLCLAQMEGKPCPICEEVQRLDKLGDDDHAKELAARKRVLVYVVDRNNEREGPLVWVMPWTVDRDLAKVSQDRSTGKFLAIDDPEYGYDVQFDKEGEGIATKYAGVAVARKETAIDPDWMDIPAELPLTDLLVRRDYNEVMELFAGRGNVDDRGKGRDDRDRDDRDDRGGFGGGRYSREREDDRGNGRAEDRGNGREADREPPPRRAAERAGRDDDRDRYRGRDDDRERPDERPSGRERGTDPYDRGERDAVRGERAAREPDDDGGRRLTRRGAERDDPPERERDMPPERDAGSAGGRARELRDRYADR